MTSSSVSRWFSRMSVAMFALMRSVRRSRPWTSFFSMPSEFFSRRMLPLFSCKIARPMRCMSALASLICLARGFCTRHGISASGFGGGGRATHKERLERREERAEEPEEVRLRGLFEDGVERVLELVWRLLRVERVELVVEAREADHVERHHAQTLHRVHAHRGAVGGRDLGVPVLRELYTKE